MDKGAYWLFFTVLAVNVGLSVVILDTVRKHHLGDPPAVHVPGLDEIRWMVNDEVSRSRCFVLLKQAGIGHNEASRECFRDHWAGHDG